MIGQRNRNHSPANALPPGGRHNGRCTLLVQHAIADPHVGRRDQFRSHGHCLHRATDTDTVTSLRGCESFIDCSHMNAPLPPRMVLLHGVDNQVRPNPCIPESGPFDAAGLASAPNRSGDYGSGSGRNCQFGRAMPSTSDVPMSIRMHGGISSTCPQCAGSGTYFNRAVFMP